GLFAAVDGAKSAKREIRPIPPSDADRDYGLKLLGRKATVRLTFSIELFSGVRVRASSNPRSTWERSTRCEWTAQRSRQGNDGVDWEMRGECRTRLRRDACASSQCGSSAALTDPQIWSSPSKPTLRQPYWRDPMAANLTSFVMQFLTPEVIEKIASFL